MIPEYESRAKHLEEQMATFSHLEEMEHKVQQLEQEFQWALVIEIEKVRNVHWVDITLVVVGILIVWCNVRPLSKRLTKIATSQFR